MRPHLGALLVNGKLKLAALALALLLWVSVSAEEPATQWLDVPVEVALLDENNVLVRGPIPAQVEVRFAGPGRELWELALNRPKLVVPVRSADADDQIYLLDPEMVRVPQSLAVSAQDLRPSSVRLVFERLARREVPVRVRTVRDSAGGLEWIDGARVRPARVEVSGREEAVAEIDTLFTLPVQLTEADPTFRRTVPLDTMGLQGVQLSADRVRVTGRVERLETRWERGIPVEAPPGLAIVPAEVDVRFYGPASPIAAVTPNAIRVFLVQDSLPRGVVPAATTVPLRIDGVPAGVSARVVPAAVRVIPFPSATPPAVQAADSLPLDSLPPAEPA